MSDSFLPCGTFDPEVPNKVGWVSSQRKRDQLWRRRILFFLGSRVAGPFRGSTASEPISTRACIFSRHFDRVKILDQAEFAGFLDRKVGAIRPSQYYRRPLSCIIGPKRTFGTPQTSNISRMGVATAPNEGTFFLKLHNRIDLRWRDYLSSHLRVNAIIWYREYWFFTVISA